MTVTVGEDARERERMGEEVITKTERRMDSRILAFGNRHLMSL
jgi:hypothetical protein